MPKPRKAGAAQSFFSISPWHDKVIQTEAQPLSATEGEDQPYNVVELPLIGQPTPAPCPSSDQTLNGGVRSPQPAAPSNSMPWQTKKRKAHRDGEPAEQDEVRLGVDGGMQGEQQESPSCIEDNLDDVLEGTAVLAILPNNSITGHLLPREGRRRSIGLMGREVLAYRDCTRDAEWRVLRMTAIDFGGAREASLLVERTEGDAMKLRAPIEWQGAEVSTMEQLSQGCQPSMALEFDCEQLLVDAAADAELRRLQPSLCSRGALVNVGPLKLTWPSSDAGGQSGDSAGQRADESAQQQPPQVSGGSHCLPARPNSGPSSLQQALPPPPAGGNRSLIGGPSSGRTVKDDGDW